MIKKGIVGVSNIIKSCEVQKQIYQFARVIHKQANQQKSIFKEKDQNQKVQEIQQEFINQKNELQYENNVSQNYILNSKTHDRLFEIFNHFKGQMNIINYATCLHQAIKLQDDKNYKKLLDRHKTQIKEIFMKGFTASNYLSNIVKLNMYTPQLIEKISNLIVDNNWQFNTTQTSFIIWSLANSKCRNMKYLNYASKNLQNIVKIIELLNKYLTNNNNDNIILVRGVIRLQITNLILLNPQIKFQYFDFFHKKNQIKPQDLANIFMGLGKLKYIEEDLTTYLEAQILRESQKFTLNITIRIYIQKKNTVFKHIFIILMHLANHIFQHINMIFMSYEKYYRKNLETLDALAVRYQDLGKDLTFRNLSNMLVSCSNMNYVNQTLLEFIENIVNENQDAFDESGASILEKYANEQNIYNEEEMDLFKNLIQQNKSKDQIEQQSDKDKILSSTVEKKQNTKTNQKLSEDEDEDEDEDSEENDDGFEVLEVTSDPKTIQTFQKEFEEQKKYLETQKEKNSQMIEKYRIKDHKHDQSVELDPTNATMILLSYCKMKVVKPELFEVLEANFSKKLDQANPKDVATYSYAHSMLCSELSNKFTDSKKKFQKRSLKNIKKYNHYFYEVILPFVELNIDKYSCKQLQVIFTSASKPQVKKRSICRQMVAIANEKFQSQEEKNIFIYKHFKLLTNFAIAEQQRKDLIMTFIDNQIQINELYEKYSKIIVTNNLKYVQNDYNKEEDSQELELKFEQNQQIEEQEKNQKETKLEKEVQNENQ